MLAVMISVQVATNFFTDFRGLLPLTTGGTEVHGANLVLLLSAVAFRTGDWPTEWQLVGNADAVFVELVGQRAAGQPHAAGRFGLCATGCVQRAQDEFFLRVLEKSSEVERPRRCGYGEGIG